MLDLRYALRQLVRSPGFSIVAILTLTLGMGANTAFFSVLYGVVLRSRPIRTRLDLVSRSQRLQAGAPAMADGCRAPKSATTRTVSARSTASPPPTSAA